MHRLELTDRCRLCGEPIDPKDPRTYPLSVAALLCYECACRQGGEYDEEREDWSTTPRPPVVAAEAQGDA